jgi:predicted ATPase
LPIASGFPTSPWGDLRCSIRVMYIKELTVQNYKGFNGVQRVTWQPGFNILVGKNNSGKSALLEVVELAFSHNPHLSIVTRPDRDIPLTKPSIIDISFCVSRQEIPIYLKRLNLGQIQIPCPLVGSPIMTGLGVTSNTNEGLQKAVDWIFSHESLTFRLRRGSGPNQGPAWLAHRAPTFDLFELPAGNAVIALCSLTEDGTLRVGGSMQTAVPYLDIGTQLGELFRTDIYRFTAERFSLGRSTIGTNRFLSKDARNLPEVLNNLNATPAKLEEFKDRVKGILPDVKVFTTRIVDQQNVEVMAWNADPATGRDDLAISLDNSGTGTGQVLALLYAAIMLPRPSVVLVDEPQSFLHPGATRKLMQTLKLYPQHQYIFATHSPTVIGASDPATITIVRLENSETRLEQLDRAENSAQQTCLAELGARLSDVFGADQILWVEGPTEDRCFPAILEGVAKKRLAGVAIVPLRNTGDLKGRSSEMVIDIYNRISRGHTLIPPAVAIVFDREDYDEQARKELSRKSGGLARFLRRRMFENYLLHPQALAAVANQLENFRSQAISAEEVLAIIDAEKAKPKYYGSEEAWKDDEHWILNINGAGLLDTVFKTLSENRYEYHKIDHGLLLTREIIRIDPAFLRELAEFLSSILDEARA